MRPFWLDAQLSPALAIWLTNKFNIECSTVHRLDMSSWEDEDIFSAARFAEAVVITKDRDLVDLCHRMGPPPQIVWVRCGNTRNAELIRVFAATFPDCLQLIEAGEPVIEIRA